MTPFTFYMSFYVCVYPTFSAYFTLDLILMKLIEFKRRDRLFKDFIKNLFNDAVIIVFTLYPIWGEYQIQSVYQCVCLSVCLSVCVSNDSCRITDLRC